MPVYSALEVLALQKPFPHLGVEAGDAHVLLASTLLRLYQARGSLDADDEIACDLGVEGAAVAGLLNAQHAPNPRHHFMRGGVGGLVQVHTAVGHVLLERTLEGRIAGGDGGVVPGTHIQLVIVLEQEGPLGGV
eukprot:1137998-Pelagomonas_calceolata.AAC.8